MWLYAYSFLYSTNSKLSQRYLNALAANVWQSRMITRCCVLAILVNPLTFPLVSPAGWYLWLSILYLHSHLTDCCEIWCRHLLSRRLIVIHLISWFFKFDIWQVSKAAKRSQWQWYNGYLLVTISNSTPNCWALLWTETDGKTIHMATHFGKRGKN